MFKEKLWQYLQSTSVSKMIGQGIILLALMIVAAFSWVMATNFEYIVDRWDRYNHPQISEDQLIQDIENSVRINIGLEQLLNEVEGSARAYIFKFHNGTVGADGLSFIYQSATHMVARPGFVNNIQDLQRIPLSINPSKALSYVNGQCFDYFTDPELINNAFNTQLLEQGISHLYTCPIYNNNNLLIGFIGMDFLYAAAAPELTDEQIHRKLVDTGTSLKNYVSNTRVRAK